MITSFHLKHNKEFVLESSKIVRSDLFRYVTAGASWLNGAFGKVAKAGQVAGTKTRHKWNLAVSNLTTKVNCYCHLLVYLFP